MAAPYSAMPPGVMAAQAMMAQHVPLSLVQQASHQAPAGAPSGIVQASGSTCAPWGCPPGGLISPPGIPAAPALPGMMKPPGAVAAAGALTGGQPNPFPTQRTSVRFAGPARMKVSWYAPSPDGKAQFSQTPIDVPGRYNFLQAAIYRLKLTDIPNRPGLELYPTLEVVPSNNKTATFLAHSAVPVAFTEEDFDQVTAGNFVVKVIYLPDPQYQDLATIDEIVSSRLEPGLDPIHEAHKRGSILLVVRLGNIDLEAPNTPAMDAPSPYQMRPPMPTPMMPGAPGGRPSPGQGGPMPGAPVFMPNPAAAPGAGARPSVPMLPPPAPGPGTPVGRLPEPRTMPKAPVTPAALAGQQ
jgi:hypothetical protein